jgi:hypothetical protein
VLSGAPKWSAYVFRTAQELKASQDRLNSFHTFKAEQRKNQKAKDSASMTAHALAMYIVASSLDASAEEPPICNSALHGSRDLVMQITVASHAPRKKGYCCMKPEKARPCE